MYPSFRPTRGLYIDFEGGGSRGEERILSVYWPQLAGAYRFGMLWRGWGDAPVTLDAFLHMLGTLRCDPDTLEWVVVFSGGTDVPDEQVRFESIFGERLLARAQWVNLHKVMRRSRLLRRSVREAAWARSTGGQQRAVNCLENLEFQFGYVRPRQLRGHDYQHADGTVGQMEILRLEQEAYESGSGLAGFEYLIEYCRWDVETMFRIARWCDKNTG